MKKSLKLNAEKLRSLSAVQTVGVNGGRITHSDSDGGGGSYPAPNKSGLSVPSGRAGCSRASV